MCVSSTQEAPALGPKDNSLLPQSPYIFILALTPLPFIFFPSRSALGHVCLTSSVAFSSPHSAEQCVEPSWLGEDRGLARRKAQCRPAPRRPRARLTSRSGRPDCKSQPFFFFPLCFLVYHCLQGVTPAVHLSYARCLLAVLPGKLQASGESLPCHRAAARRVHGKAGS